MISEQGSSLVQYPLMRGLGAYFSYSSMGAAVGWAVAEPTSQVKRRAARAPARAPARACPAGRGRARDAFTAGAARPRTKVVKVLGAVAHGAHEHVVLHVRVHQVVGAPLDLRWEGEERRGGRWDEEGGGRR